MSPMSERLELRLDEDVLKDIEAWRARQADVPSRSEAIRRLIERGLSVTSNEPLRFSAGETLTIHMLCELLKAQKAKSEIDPDFVQSALYGGHLWGLKWKYSGVFPTHSDSPSVVEEVVGILDMWDFIEGGYAKLTKKEKERVAKEAAPFGEKPAFHGFDGNNESEHCGVARFLVEDLARFSRFKGRDFNSHIPSSVPTNIRMLKVFLPIRATLTGGGLTDTQIIQILKARAQPSRRSE